MSNSKMFLDTTIGKLLFPFFSLMNQNTDKIEEKYYYENKKRSRKKNPVEIFVDIIVIILAMAIAIDRTRGRSLPEVAITLAISIYLAPFYIIYCYFVPK